MTSENTTPDTGLDDLLNRNFPGKVVRKDLTKLVKEGANVPVYVLEYLLGSYCASNDEAVIEGIDAAEVAHLEPGHDIAIEVVPFARCLAEHLHPRRIRLGCGSRIVA